MEQGAIPVEEPPVEPPAEEEVPMEDAPAEEEAPAEEPPAEEEAPVEGKSQFQVYQHLRPNL